MGDLEADYRLLRMGVGAVPVARDAVRVSGPDAQRFLQGQCSQDVEGLAVGASSWSFVLQPQGKVDALVRVTRMAEDGFVLDTDGGWGQAVVNRLTRFKLRVKADIELLDWKCVSLRGPGAVAVGRAVTAGSELLVVDAGWPGLPGTDLLGADPEAPDGVGIVSAGAYQVVRIEAGVPVMGAELTERTIPAETGIVQLTVSFTKGCFTGQELVARMDSRSGEAPRHLRGVVIPDKVPPTGATVVFEGTQVGVLTSVAPAPGGGAVALAYISRRVEPAASATAEWEGGSSGRVSIRPLPLAG